MAYDGERTTQEMRDEVADLRSLAENQGWKRVVEKAVAMIETGTQIATQHPNLAGSDERLWNAGGAAALRDLINWPGRNIDELEGLIADRKEG